jgi:hypothetical protein
MEEVAEGDLESFTAVELMVRALKPWQSCSRAALGESPAARASQQRGGHASCGHTLYRCVVLSAIYNSTLCRSKYSFRLLLKYSPYPY